MDKATIEQLVQNWLDEALDEDVPYTPKREDDLHGYADLLHDRLLDHRWGTMQESTDDLLKGAGLSLKPDDRSYRLLCRRLLEGHLEYVRIQLDRLNGNYAPLNHGLKALAPMLPPPTPQVQTLPPETTPLPPVTRHEAPPSQSFMAVVAQYYKENTPRSKRSAEQIKLEFKRFLVVVGGSGRIGDITKEDCRRYKDHLLTDRKLRLVTVIKWIGMVGAIYRWASKQGFVPENYDPTRGLSPNMKRAKAEVQGYRDYTDEELLTVFSSPEFLRQRVKHPERYWSVLLLLFTGARREEICQLNLCDIQEIDGITILNITDKGEGQALKNDNSRRKVPVHSSLVQLGFMDFVQAQRAVTGRTRLFHKFKKKGGTFGNPVGHWFNRLVKRVGLGGKGLVLHGLRHSAITRMADVGVNDKVRRTLVGHAGVDVHDRIYSHAERMKVSLLRDGIEGLRYDVVVQALSIKGQDSPSGTQSDQAA